MEARSVPEPAIEERDVAAYVVEFVGTFFLVMFICWVLTTQSGVLKTADFAVIGLVHVFILAMLVAALGGTSGAHFNPAVTVALASLRKIGTKDAGIYIVMQMLGAVAGALVIKLILNDEGAVSNYGAVSVSPLLSGDLGGFFCELIGTMALMWAIMGVAVNARAERAWAPLIIGGTLGLAVMCIGPLTGAGFNPARAFGPDLIAGEFDGAGTFLFVYCLGPIVGALLAAFGYHYSVIARETRPIDKLG